MAIDREFLTAVQAIDSEKLRELHARVSRRTSLAVSPEDRQVLHTLLDAALLIAHDRPPTTTDAATPDETERWLAGCRGRDADEALPEDEDEAGRERHQAIHDRRRLLSLVDRQSALLQDVATEGEGEMARRWERAAISGLLASAASHLDTNGRPIGTSEGDMLRNIAQMVRERGDTPQDAPDPSACRREIDRLRAALREIAGATFTGMHADGGRVGTLQEMARKALGEG